MSRLNVSLLVPTEQPRSTHIADHPLREAMLSTGGYLQWRVLFSRPWTTETQNTQRGHAGFSGLSQASVSTQDRNRETLTCASYEAPRSRVQAPARP